MKTSGRSPTSSSKRSKVGQFFTNVGTGVQDHLGELTGLLRRKKAVVSTTKVNGSDVAFVISPLDLPSVSLSKGDSATNAVFAEPAPSRTTPPSLVREASAGKFAVNVNLGITTSVASVSLSANSSYARESPNMAVDSSTRLGPSLTTTKSSAPCDLQPSTSMSPQDTHNYPPTAVIKSDVEEQVTRTPTQKFKDALVKFKTLLIRKVHIHVHQKTDDSGYFSASNDNDGGNDDDDGDGSGRCQWDVISAIPTSTYNDLLKSLPYAKENIKTTYVDDLTFGTYHLVIFMRALNKQSVVEDFVIKVPGHGTPDRWRPEDAYMLIREAETMKHLYLNTEMPVPEILDYSSTLDNTVGFPYIIMRRLPGEDAYNIWFDQPYDPETAYMTADCPSIETEKKRLTFLRSLAQVMTELEKVQFDGVGMPLVHSDDIESHHKVGKTYLWTSVEDIHKVEERGPVPSTYTYARSALDTYPFPELGDPEEYDDGDYAILGLRKVLDIIFSGPVFTSGADETYVLQHDDLDLQNILTDSLGNITGIIDWDGSLAMPRCVGHAAVPKFLRRDWFPDRIARISPMAWRTEHYRQIYASAMVEAGNPDAKYTAKSAIYQSLLCALYEGGEVVDIVEKLMRKVPGFQTNVTDFLTFLGKGSPAAEGMLRTELGKILDPKLPQPNFPQQVEAEVYANDRRILEEWWTAFDAYFSGDSGTV
jgi:serine/threonine protein kinase